MLVLSVSVAFAATDDSAVGEIDEIADEDVLAIDDDSFELEDDGTASNSNVVTNDTFYQYFTDTGEILDNVTSDELIFEGDFTNVGVNYITIEKSITLTGKNATFNNVAFSIFADDVTIDGFTLNMDGTDISLIAVGDAKNVELSNNVINFKSMDDQNGYAIFACDVDNLKLLNNTFTYVGTTDGNSVNNVIRAYSDEKKSANILVEGNVFNITMPSSKVSYDEYYNSISYTDGLVFIGCENLTINSNNITLNYSEAVGSYDTIHVLVAGNSNYELDWDTFDYAFPNVCKNVVISDNEINANGHMYIYGISVAADDSDISGNTLNIASDNHYAAAFEVGGPSNNTGISSNLINVEAPNLAYGIYSYSYMAPIGNCTYVDNDIKCEAYASCGMEIINENPIIKDNSMILKGNHTMGIVANIVENEDMEDAVGVIANNKINSLGTNIGTDPTGDGYVHIESTGIAVNGNTLIENNKINSTAIGVDLKDHGIGGEITLNSNEIFVNAAGATNNYAIYAEKIDALTINQNNVTFVGSTEGTVTTNALYIKGIDDTQITKNNFDISIPSSYVPWAEIPAGSGNWVSSPISEGIIVDSSKDVIFEENNVDLTYNNVLGLYDTIYAVDFRSSNGAVINKNKINSLGHTYIYGIIFTGDNFTISDNNITSESDIFYANGIDIEGPASGVVENNVIDVKAPTSVYAIYSGMNGQDVSADYIGNNLTGDAYNVFGFSLGDVESNIENNNIDLKGNYTTGIAFRGSVLNVKDNNIYLESSEAGNESVWESFGVETVAVKVIKGNATIANNVIAGEGKGISIADSNANIENNFINIVANNDKDAYAIYATDVPSLNIKNNTFDYQGTTKGTGVNNVIYLSNATGARITENKFDMELVSCYVPWKEVPAGTGNWVSFPVSEGIVVSDSDDVTFDSNTVNATYGDVSGSYDTIYTISFKNSDNAAIANNEINALGHTYIYAIQMCGENFTISANNITSESDIYYANGIDIEGPASGVVANNGIIAKAPVSAYVVYSGMNGQNASVNYTDNDLVGEAYNAFGMSLGDVESNVVGNDIVLAGNYTTGIAYRGSKLTIDNTLISANGTNVGNESIWEGFGVQTVGVKVIMGEATIANNNIKTTGEYTVNVTDTNSSVHDNYLTAKELFGDESVSFTGGAEVKDNTPKLSTIVQVNEITVDLPEDATGNVTVFVDGKEYATLKAKETLRIPFDNLSNGNHNVEVKYSGDGKYAPKSTNSTLFVSKPKIDTIITVTPAFTRYATDYYAGERGALFYATLTDINGNPLANKTVQIAVNGPIYNVTTDENGRAGLQVNLAAANTYTYALSFQGDDDYNAAPLASTKLTVIKKTASISASAKSFKSTAKTKKITVTLKTMNNPYNKKNYLKSGKTITLKINGVTYTAKTNAKGQATFSIKLTKKGKYTAAISFAGDKTYNAASNKITVSIT